MVDAWIIGYFRVLKDFPFFTWKLASLHDMKKIQFHMIGVVFGLVLKQGLRASRILVRLGYPFIWDTNPSHFKSLGISVGSTEINMNSGDNHNTISGCEEKMGSRCISNPCPNNSTCREEFDSYKCICPVGYVGKHCARICSLKPCRHGKCESVDSKKGFRCVCPQQYTGKWEFSPFSSYCYDEIHQII